MTVPDTPLDTRTPLAAWIPLLVDLLGLPAEEVAARSRQESFTALGGTSLQAIALTADGQRHLARDVEVARLLGTLPLAEALAGARAYVRTDPAPRPAGAEPRDRELLPGQKAMLAAHLAGRDQAYHLMFTLQPDGPLDPDRTQAALHALTARHESLRTLFTEHAGGARRTVLPAGHTPRLLHQRLPDGTDPVRAVHELYGRRAAELLRPFEQPPVVFVRTDTGERTLLTVLVHHVLADGWSIGVLWREFARLHQDGPAVLPATAPSPDWTATRLAAKEADGTLAAATDRVTARLAGAPLVAALPGDHPRAEEADGRGERLLLALEPALADAVERLARHARTTVTSVLLAAWALAAARRAATDDLLLGVAASGRSEAGMADLVALCTRIVPVRCRTGGRQTATDYVRATAAALADAVTDADLPFAHVVGALAGEVDGSRNPVAQIGFAAHHDLVPDSFDTADGSRWQVHEGHCHGSVFDALLFVQDWSRRPRLAVEYASSAQSAADAGELTESFRAVLAELAARPDRPIDEVTGLSAAQHRRLAELGDGTPFATDDDLWTRFEQQAASRPDALAVDDPYAGVTLTYRQLHAHALAQAERLREVGVRPGDRVVLELPRSAAEAVAVLGVLSLPAAYVAVDPGVPADRRARIAATTTPTARIGGTPDDPALTAVPTCPPATFPEPAQPTAADHAAAVPAVLAGPSSGGTPAVPQGSPVALLPEGVPAAAGARAGAAAYISFTSGTTGEPKGVVVPHRAVLRLADDERLFADPAAGVRMLRLSPLAFDASTLELLVPLATGGTVVVHPPEEPTPAGLAAFLPASGTTHAWLTSGLFHLVADHRPEAFAGLRQLFTGGGVVSPDHVRRVLRRCTGLRVTNGYGPTENTTFTAVCHADGAHEVPDPFPIGSPVRGTALRIVDAAGRPVPPGAVGELRAAGAGLADGYLGDPERTAEVFTDLAGLREYRTGDLVRWGADGRLRFLGRADRQVKIAGHRVEPVAVERRIREQPGVLDAVVFLAAERLCAAVKAPDGLLAAVREAVEPGLAPYERPQRWLAVDAFPLDRNGKVDLRALAALAAPPFLTAPPALTAPSTLTAPPPETASAPAAVPTAVPAADLEELISEAWAEVLGTDDFDPDEGFFDVGGDSLGVALVRRRLQERLGGRPIPLTDLYRFPSVQALAAHLRTTTTGVPR
ncbi:amino acid adenylation domain-containing protein [Kitasatospora sp. NPDC048365]|uniref:amino acid adenylation domain-containing protein n=1 Tax=Kitasatospora sp. NPDC048365 TaxID=3364050 RepID=UPI00371AC153